MQKQNLELNFKGQNIYVGIDIHLKSWAVTVLTEHITHKTFTQPPNVQILFNYLYENFPGATYYSAYEAGFSGYWTHHQLLSLGINNIVINPADIPTMQKELFQKSDSIDSRKIARALRAKELTPIHVMSRQTLEDHSLVRTKSLLVQDITKNRVKSFLYFHGISIPAKYIKKNGHWSKKFIKWLKEEVILPSSSEKEALNSLILNVENLYANLKDINNKFKLQCESDRYRKNIILLQSIPGLDWLSSIVIMTHIEDIK